MPDKETFEEWLNRVAEIKPWDPGEGQDPIDTYRSRIDAGYLCFTSLTDDVRWMYDRGFEQLQSTGNDGTTCALAFCPSEQKWYGWSHRAVYGFGVGSAVKKGDLGYIPVNADDFLEWAIRFWDEPDHVDIAGIKDVTNEHGALGCQISWVYSDTVPNKSIRGTVGESFMYYPKQWGKGEWIAETIDDAKQMATDFAESVS